MQEVEWQFDAVELRPVLRWLDARRPVDAPVVASASKGNNGHPRVAFLPSEPRDIVDTYFDTPDWRFHRAGLAVRVRRQNGSFEGHLKSIEPAKDGLRQRTEITTALPSGEPSALLETESRAGLWVRSLAGGQPPKSLFTLHSNRRVYTILADGQPIGEVVLDETSFDQPGTSEPVRIKRVEVEVAPPSVDFLRPFVDDLRSACRLTPATASKFEVGLLTLERGPTGLPEVGPLTVSEAPSMGELGFAVLRRAFLEFLRSEPGTRVGEEIEALHDMRVASRRMRAALALFEPALPVRARRIRGELRWVAGLLGAVRDLDTQLRWIASWSEEATPDDRPSLEALRVALEKRRERARRRMLQGLDSARYARLVTRLTRTLVAGPSRRSPAARTAALEVFPEVIARRHARVRKARKALRADSPTTAYHGLRIRCKRLRYAVENARDLYGATASGYVDVLARLQDLLGLHQDAVVAVARLQELLQSATRRLPPRVVFMMGRASQRHDQQAAKLRKRLGKVYPPVEGKAWSRLQRAMEKGRGQEAAEWPPRTPQARRPATTSVEA